MCIFFFFQGAKTGDEKEDIVLEESDKFLETQPAKEISNIAVKEEEPPRGKVKTKYLHRRCRILCFQKCCFLDCFIGIALDWNGLFADEIF